MNHEPLLNILLRELKDGVIVCGRDGEILLFNRAATEQFDRNPLLTEGGSLYNLCFRAPVQQALDLLLFQRKRFSQSDSLPYVQFINSGADREQYFRCRVSLLEHESGTEGSFVLLLEDISTWYTPDNPLYMKIEEFRAPMTNLRAAVENLTEYPEMSPVMRSAFENVLVQESLNLTDAFDSLARSCNVLMQSRDHLSEVNTEILFGYLARFLNSGNIPVTPAADPAVRVKVDIYGLVLLLTELIKHIRHIKKNEQLSCITHIGEKFIFIDLIWPGTFLTTGVVKEILAEELENSIGRMSVNSLLHSMGGDLWSQQQDKSKGLLRLALPIAARLEA